MTYERIRPEQHKEKAQELRQRFWDIFRQRPDSLKNYAKLVGIHYNTFGDFVMSRSILTPENYIRFENWVLDQENK